MADLLPFTSAELVGLKKTLPDCEISPYIRVILDRLIATIERRDEQIEKLREFHKRVVAYDSKIADSEDGPNTDWYRGPCARISLEALAATEPPK